MNENTLKSLLQGMRNVNKFYMSISSLMIERYLALSGGMECRATGTPRIERSNKVLDETERFKYLQALH